VGNSGVPTLSERKVVPVRLFRVIVPVGSIEGAAAFYARVLGAQGRRVSPGRHYFDCEGTILACYDPRADGDAPPQSPAPAPNPGHLYLATDDLNGTRRRLVEQLGERGVGPIEDQPWGERTIYANDPWGNRLCFVDRGTMFTGAR
jgi:catechol 2,3-dioxygenase-like lactoylglutathione lyase family enzyme